MFVIITVHGIQEKGSGNSIKEAIEDAVSNIAISLRKDADDYWKRGRKEQADIIHAKARQLENYVKENS